MDMRSPLGRRRLFRAGALSAAGVALGVSAQADDAHAAGRADAAGTTDPDGPGRTEQLTIPDPVPGTKAITLGFAEFASFGFGVAATAVHIGGGRYYAPSSRLILPITLPIGTVVRRVDVFGSTDKPTSWVITRTGPAEGSETSVAFPASAELVVSITPEDQSPLAPGQVLSLIGIGADNVLNFGHAAIVHYEDPPEEARPGPLYPIDPVRVYDSRRPAPTPGRLTSGMNRLVSVADGRDTGNGAIVLADAIPDGATAVAYNLTAAATVRRGFLSITPGDATSSPSSSINWTTNDQAIANAGIVKLDASRQVKVFCGGLGSAHFVIDITGYFR